MATRERRLDRGRDQASRIIRSTGVDIRLARRGAGVSLRVAASAVGMNHSTFSRIESGRNLNVTITQLALASAAVGLKFVGRPYPDGDPVRDFAQVNLLTRLRHQLHPDASWRTEVPLPIQGDRRAWDAVCVQQGVTIGIEAETRLDDLQALERRIALKGRDGGIAVVVLLIADTRSNRGRLAEHREALRPGFPLDTRAVMAALRAGRPPTSSGIVIL